MSIYATQWILKFPRFGDAHSECEWVTVLGQGVLAHAGTPAEGYGHESDDPFASFLPPPLPVAGGVAGHLRALVVVRESTEKLGQEYVAPLLVLSGAEYAALPFQVLHDRICDALRGSRPRLVAEVLRGSDRQLVFDDGSFCLHHDGDSSDAPSDCLGHSTGSAIGATESSKGATAETVNPDVLSFLREPLTVREEEAIALKLRGATFATIGAKLGVSSSRAAQLIKAVQVKIERQRALTALRNPLDCPIDLLPMPAHRRRALMRTGCTTLRELSRLTNAQLFRVPGVGSLTLRQIRAYCRRLIRDSQMANGEW